MYNLVVLLHGPGRGSGWRNNGVSCTCRTRTRGRGRTAAACAIEIKSGSLGCRCQCAMRIRCAFVLVSNFILNELAALGRRPLTAARNNGPAGAGAGGLSGRLLLGGGGGLFGCACVRARVPVSFRSERVGVRCCAEHTSLAFRQHVCIDVRCYAKAMRIKCGRVCAWVMNGGSQPVRCP